MIGLINDCYLPVIDGVSMTVHNYAQLLSKKGRDVCVISPEVPGATYDFDFPVYRYFSVPIPRKKPYRYGIPLLDLPFQQKMESIPFQLVHAHSPFSAGEVALGIAKKQNVPLIATFHSKYKDDFRRYFKTDLIVDQIIKHMIDFFQQADQVWIPQAEVEETIREYGYKGKVEVVDNGNDYAGMPYNEQLRRGSRRKLGIDDDKTPVFLFVGQHIWEKNVELIIRSVARLNRDYKMFFIGDGYARHDMMGLAKELKLIAEDNSPGGDKVEFVGTVSDRDELRTYYLAADLFLFPSLYDNAPLVVREASAMRLPAIMVKGSTGSGILTDGVNGFLTDNNIDSFVGTLNYLMDHPEIVRQVGAEASITLSRSWEDIVGEVSDRYDHLIKTWNKK